MGLFIGDNKEKTGVWQLETTSMHTEIAQASVVAIIHPGFFIVDLLSGFSSVMVKTTLGFVYNMGKYKKPRPIFFAGYH